MNPLFIPSKAAMHSWSILKALEEQVEAESFVEWCERTEYRGLVKDILDYPKESPFKELRAWIP